MNKLELNTRPLSKFVGYAAHCGFSVTLFLLALLAMPMGATAQQRVFLDAYRQAETTEDGFSFSRPLDRGHLKWGGHLTVDYGHRVLAVDQVLANGTNREVFLVEGALTGQLTLSLGLLDKIVLFAGLPVNLWMDGESTSTLPGPDSFAVGDVRLGGRFLLVGKRRDVAALAIQLAGTAPSAKVFNDEIHYSGERGFTGSPKLLLEVRAPGLIFTGNLGFTLREKKVVFSSLDIQHELRYGLGLTIPAIPKTLNVYVEGYGGTELRHVGERPHTPVEAIGGLRFFTPEGIALGAAAGGGVVRGYGASEVRVIGSIGWSQPIERKHREETPITEETPAEDLDPDRDGVLGTKDHCPLDAEDLDKFEDQDGCPELDNDRDGVSDSSDKCPKEPEDKDQFQDEDGCPDPDNDGDGIPDQEDQAPNDPEDLDGFEDSDGIPDPDNDDDGVADLEDKCPLTVGKPEDEGCPKNVRMEGEQIVILQKIQFANGKSEILKGSFPLLEGVRLVLETNPQVRKVRIEGHTDSTGKDANNLALSQSRAESVRQWLIKRGIAENRLDAQGFGETRIILKESGQEDKDASRRVEFHIADPAPGKSTEPPP